jgi:hypothetical protein
MNVDKLTEAGWKATTTLENGIRGVYESLEDKDWY